VRIIGANRWAGRLWLVLAITVIPVTGGLAAPPAEPLHDDEQDGFYHARNKYEPFTDHCTDCHAPDLTGGLGPSCYSCHDREWNGNPSDSLPPLDHTELKGGYALHKPGYETPFASECTACHGLNLNDGFAPSCYTCHQTSAPHDFSGRPWLNPADTACTVCHDWSSNWNHALSATTEYTVSTTTLAAVGDPSGPSAKCLGCHEGPPDGPAVDDFTGTLSDPPADFIDPSVAFGTDLTHHHPVSFTFDSFLATAHGGLNDPSTTDSGLAAGGTIAEDMLETGSLECTACHDPHDNTYGSFRVLPTNEDLCFTCHIRTLPAGTTGIHHIPLRNAPWGRGVCTMCHGANLDGVGGSGPACTDCHNPFLAPDPPPPGHHGGDRHQPFLECVECHGLDLEGAAYGSIWAPSCNDCHGDVWDGVNQPPLVDAGGPYSESVGETIHFDASGTVDLEGNPLSYEWSFGDTGGPRFFSRKPTATYVYNGIGTYNGTLAVSDGINEPVVVPFTVEISDASGPPGPESGQSPPRRPRRRRSPPLSATMRALWW